MTRTRIIAEIGENHEGDWDRARSMIAAAAGAGADIVKFQSYLARDVADDDPEKDWFGRVAVPDELHAEFKTLVEQHGAQFLSSAFSLERARFLIETLGLQSIKVASSEMLNVALLEFLNASAHTVFLSTGMATIDEVRDAVSRLRDVPDLCILHCTTAYPCPPEDANLSALGTLHEAFPHRTIGFSDHTIGPLASLAAVALGATVIEKHFTLDKSLPGTDHVLSATPAEFRQLVTDIRQIEVLLGRAAKHPTAGELDIRDAVRRRFANARS